MPQKILVVDDEPDTIEYVTAIIEDMGDYQVLSASNGEEAVEKAEAELPDLIILDVMMPKKDGYAAFTELQEEESTKNIPVIMLSSLAALGEYLRGPVEVRPKLFVDKPIEPEKLERIITRILESG